MFADAPPPVPVNGAHVVSFTYIDVIAVVLGILCAVVVCYRKGTLDAENFILGFAPGTSTVYLLSMAVFMWFPDNPIYDQITHSNVVLLFGAFFVGVVANVKTIYNTK